ncbi:helix-turn-helix domain-containing protein [Streptomyces sp. M19]
MSDEQRVENAARGLLRGIGRLSEALFRAGDFGLPRSHAGVLDALDSRPYRVTELALATGLAQPRVTVVLQELEERGLVERSRCAGTGAWSRPRSRPRAGPCWNGAAADGRALLDALRTHVDDPEQVVGVARDAVSTLLHAIEPEVS